MKVIIAAAGTGGHINPGLAIANKIKEEEKDSEIIFIGTTRGLENDLVPRAGYKLKTIEAYGLSKKISIDNMKKMCETLKATSKARKIIKEFKPASGNTMAKLANDIIDGTATMAVKSHLRRERPVVIGISTNNGLSGAGENIGKLLNRKHFYFVPFRQDNPITKPRSLVFDPTYLSKTIEYALDNEQIQPIIL